jgi:DNA-directed RNA polymerase alpha subunit
MEKEIKRIRENNDKETESPINLYTISVESLAFSNRAYNILKRQGLNTVGDIIDFYKEHGIDGLMKIRNMGRRSLDEILDKIGYHSWHFEYDDCD